MIKENDSIIKKANKCPLYADVNEYLAFQTSF